ncbi:MAG: hypothetical protein KAS32_30905 [Candidatus Peribacteraceae bacterium]|nr:hypothetical protein [Candidatus Peribacteraceae bacterium]
MRDLTLDEKISIKGLLTKKGLHGLARLTMKEALHLWYQCYGKPMSMWNTRKMWCKRRIEGGIPQYTPIAKYTIGCCYYGNKDQPYREIEVVADNLQEAIEKSKALLNPDITETICHIKTVPNNTRDAKQQGVVNEQRKNTPKPSGQESTRQSDKGRRSS